MFATHNLETSAKLNRAKIAVARSSVVAAIGLTAAKLVVGITSGSIGILAEAAHSALDLVAAILTLLAVHYSSRPPDVSHHYGHGKVENLSAFLEAGLLLLTCTWIVYEAADRLLFHAVHVEPSPWAFAVMLGAIAIDWTRSRALMRVARLTNSQALEADALHFSTDIWSSLAVVFGLVLVTVADLSGREWLGRADAVAALVVAFVTVKVSTQLLRETIDALLDRAPETLSTEIREAVSHTEGVLTVPRVRVRRGGSVTFVDLVITTGRVAQFVDAHALTERIETTVRERVPGADVVVHVEPVKSPDETIAEIVYHNARIRGGRAHDVQVRDTGSGLEADFHFEVPRSLTLAEAHRSAAALETDVKLAYQDLTQINIHIEAPHDGSRPQREVTREQIEIARRITNVANTTVGSESCREVRLYRPEEGEGFDAVIRLALPDKLSIEEAHHQTEAVERALRIALSPLRDILIRAEPVGPSAGSAQD